jgi:phosphate/sulfate permease
MCWDLLYLSMILLHLGCGLLTCDKIKECSFTWRNGSGVIFSQGNAAIAYISIWAFIGILSPLLYPAFLISGILYYIVKHYLDERKEREEERREYERKEREEERREYEFEMACKRRKEEAEQEEEEKKKAQYA